MTLFGDSDVGDFMMVTGFRCWWQNHSYGDFFRYVGIKSATNILNRSPTSQICHQHIWIRHLHQCDQIFDFSKTAIHPGHSTTFRNSEFLADLNPDLELIIAQFGLGSNPFLKLTLTLY